MPLMLVTKKIAGKPWEFEGKRGVSNKLEALVLQRVDKEDEMGYAQTTLKAFADPVMLHGAKIGGVYEVDETTDYSRGRGVQTVTRMELVGEMNLASLGAVSPAPVAASGAKK